MDELIINPFELAGWLLCVAVLIWAIISITSLLRSRQLLNQQYLQGSLLLEEKFNLMRERRKRVMDQSVAWEGFANFVVVRKVLHGDSGICSFYLKPKDERLELAPFQPGQHLVFQLPIAGAAAPLTRRYSLSDRPGQDYYRVSIKLQLPPRDAPDAPPGVGSSYFHNELDEESASSYKSLIQVSSPAGAFSDDPLDSKPVVLIGGGVGITPMLSMLNSIIEENESREAWLFYTIRANDENVLFDEDMLHPRIAEVMRTRSNIHLHIHYTQIKEPGSLPNDLPFPIDQHCGRLTVDQFKTILPSNNYRFFICGPERMMVQLSDDLVSWGVPEEDVLYEHFAAPTKRKTANDSAEKGTIRFAKSNKEIEISADDGSILDAAERAEVPVSYDCRAGSCGQCMVAVVSGKVSYSMRTNYKCPPGSCLTCSCLPDGDVVLDC
ncbi:MAG: 2Fe-2S iron-sulfur cluster binding domain-containing protein [Verrucomicrobia bacterium]|nr:2Fe-2S iron-sulfur cluster binding domain-containing protein [Verrucomicrobiota bacterium]